MKPGKTAGDEEPKRLKSIKSPKEKVAKAGKVSKRVLLYDLSPHGPSKLKGAK